jgi:hypothetical protein
MKIKAGIALLIALSVASGQILAQDAGTVLRNAVTRIPEVTLVKVEQSSFPYQNSWTAVYRSAKFKPIGLVAGDLQVRLDVLADSKAANSRAEQSRYTTSMGPDRRETFEGRALYVWERFGSRLLYQLDAYVINIMMQGKEPDRRIAMSLLRSLVTELESTKPQPRLVRVRDVPDPDRWALSWGAQTAFFREQNFVVLPWDDAFEILLNRELRGGTQYSTRWLTIYCANGDTFLTQQPEIDGYIRLAQARSIRLPGFVSEADGWSDVVSGLRGRLIATPVPDTRGPQVKIELELENVTNNPDPIAIWWTDWTPMLKLSLEDEAFPLNGLQPGGNRPVLPGQWLILPRQSSLRMTVSKAAYEYVKPQTVWFRPTVFQGWLLPESRTSKLYVSGTLTPEKSREKRANQWGLSLPLRLPRVELP